jgi:hypothetical protein
MLNNKSARVHFTGGFTFWWTSNWGDNRSKLPSETNEFLFVTNLHPDDNCSRSVEKYTYAPSSSFEWGAWGCISTCLGHIVNGNRTFVRIE